MFYNKQYLLVGVNVTQKGHSTLSSSAFFRNFNSLTAFLMSSSGAPDSFKERIKSP